MTSHQPLRIGRSNIWPKKGIKLKGRRSDTIKEINEQSQEVLNPLTLMRFKLGEHTGNAVLMQTMTTLQKTIKWK